MHPRHFFIEFVSGLGTIAAGCRISTGFTLPKASWLAYSSSCRPCAICPMQHPCRRGASWRIEHQSVRLVRFAALRVGLELKSWQFELQMCKCKSSLMLKSCWYLIALQLACFLRRIENDVQRPEPVEHVEHHLDMYVYVYNLFLISELHLLLCLHLAG